MADSGKPLHRVEASFEDIPNSEDDFETDIRRDGVKNEGSSLEVAAPWHRLVFGMTGP